MKVLIACEYSGAVRDAFRALGHEAMSCDLLPTEVPGPHYQGDVRDVLNEGWDLLVAHPPCTHLAVSGAKHFPRKRASGEQQEAIAFAKMLWEAPIHRIAMENPISILSTHIRKPDQIIHPYMFDESNERKATCWWLKNLPLLVPTRQHAPPYSERVWKMPPGPNRWKERSRTLPGCAAAYASQWGGSDETLRAVG